MKSIHAQSSPFTLVEVMVAMSILALFGTSSYMGLLMAYRMINSARCHQEAQALALDAALETYHQDYDEVLNEDAVSTGEVPAYSGLYELGGTVRTAVSHMGAYCLIDVRVDWNDVAFGGKTRVASETATLRRYNTDL